jgi:acyl-CoA thioesterase I
MTCSNVRAILLVVASIILASTSFASAQIVVLGHSAAHGYVAANDMWSSVLEGILRARGSQVHVINAGVNGETTRDELARVDSALPNGTRIVILTINGFNDNHKDIVRSGEAPANIAAIKRKITARGIRLIDAMGLYDSVMKQPGMALGDHLHLSVEGNKKLATILAGML